jgi:hypothetical protein
MAGALTKTDLYSILSFITRIYVRPEVYVRAVGIYSSLFSVTL